MQNKKRNREKGHLVNDPTLLKIYRIYEHDESVKTLKSEMSKINQEVGILKSEKSELLDENLRLKTLISNIPEQVVCEAGGIPLTVDDNPKVPEKIKKDLKKLRKDVDEWRNKYFQLLHQKQT